MLDSAEKVRNFIEKEFGYHCHKNSVWRWVSMGRIKSHHVRKRNGSHAYYVEEEEVVKAWNEGRIPPIGMPDPIDRLIVDLQKEFGLERVCQSTN